MPTQSFNSSYGTSWIGDDGGRCPKCGKPYLYVGDGAENIICQCKLLDRMKIKPLSDFWGGFRDKVYAGKIAGIPIYVNSEKDRIELVEIIKNTFSLDNIYFYKEEG